LEVCPVPRSRRLKAVSCRFYRPIYPDRMLVNNHNTTIIYITMAASLSSSVTSLQSSLQLLDNSITTLDSGVNDFPRLCKVLSTTRVCSFLSVIARIDKEAGVLTVYLAIAL